MHAAQSGLFHMCAGSTHNSFSSEKLANVFECSTVSEVPEIMLIAHMEGTSILIYYAGT